MLPIDSVGYGNVCDDQVIGKYQSLMACLNTFKSCSKLHSIKFAFNV